MHAGLTNPHPQTQKRPGHRARKDTATGAFQSGWSAHPAATMDIAWLLDDTEVRRRRT